MTAHRRKHRKCSWAAKFTGVFAGRVQRKWTRRMNEEGGREELGKQKWWGERTPAAPRPRLVKQRVQSD